MSDLVFVQFNANLIEKNKRRKLRNREVLKADDGCGAREWIVDVEEEEEEKEENEVEASVDEESSNHIGTRKSVSRELNDEEFESEDEEIDKEDEYESGGVEIIEQYGQDGDGFWTVRL